MAMTLETLRKAVRAACDEIDHATVMREAWKPAANDAALHARMSHTYGGHTFLTIRLALRREMLLALCRMWDTSRRTVRMEDLRVALNNKSLIDQLARERAGQHEESEAFYKLIRPEFEKLVGEAATLIDKYRKGGTGVAMLAELKKLRHERLAHRALDSDEDAVIEVDVANIDAFYADNCEIVSKLLHLVAGEAYAPQETAEVFGLYAAKFWGCVQGGPKGRAGKS